MVRLGPIALEAFYLIWSSKDFIQIVLPECPHKSFLCRGCFIPACPAVVDREADG